MMSEHVTLRQFHVTDAASLAFALFDSRHDLRDWIRWIPEQPFSIAECLVLIHQLNAEWQKATEFHYGIFIGEQLVGGCALQWRTSLLHDGRAMHIGYWTRRGFTGNGYATIAARQLTDTAFMLAHVNTIEIWHDKANNKSAAIPRRIGYRHVRDLEDMTDADPFTGRTRCRSVWEMTVAKWRSSRDGFATEPGPEDT